MLNLAIKNSKMSVQYAQIIFPVIHGTNLGVHVINECILCINNYGDKRILDI